LHDNITETSFSDHKYFNLIFLPHAVSCGRFCFWRLQSVGFFVCVWNISGTAERICAKFTQKTWLVPRSDEFEGHQGQKTAFSSGLCVVYVWWNIFSL